MRKGSGSGAGSWEKVDEADAVASSDRSALSPHPKNKKKAGASPAKGKKK